MNDAAEAKAAVDRDQADDDAGSKVEEGDVGTASLGAGGRLQHKRRKGGVGAEKADGEHGPPGPVVEKPILAEAEDARSYLRRIAETFDGSGIEVETEMVEGDPEWVIEHQAKELNASLIVMASHGRSGLARLLHGSVSDEVVRGSSVPIMLVRPAETRKGGKGA
jgi:nucleotide-binding universal stress UspA family protein